MTRRRRHALRARVGARLRAIREGRGLSQADLASSAGLTQSGLSRIEAGRRGMTVEELLLLGPALGVPATALLGEDVVPAAS